jgi:hypothetical protein
VTGSVTTGVQDFGGQKWFIGIGFSTICGLRDNDTLAPGINITGSSGPTLECSNDFMVDGYLIGLVSVITGDVSQHITADCVLALNSAPGGTHTAGSYVSNNGSYYQGSNVLMIDSVLSTVTALVSSPPIGSMSLINRYNSGAGSGFDLQGEPSNPWQVSFKIVAGSWPNVFGPWFHAIIDSGAGSPSYAVWSGGTFFPGVYGTDPVGNTFTGGICTMLGGGAGGSVAFFGVGAVGQQTGGAATAGGTYTAAEQGIINRMYSALRAYGLLS